MAWDGVAKIERLGKFSAKIVFTKFDADNEESHTLFPIDTVKLGFIPSFAKIISTNVEAALTYDIALQGSLDGTNWDDIVTNTAKDTVVKTIVDYTSAVGDPTPAAYPNYRILAPDVTDGAATEHTVTVWLWR